MALLRLPLAAGLVTAALLLAGCATGPISAEHEVRTESDRSSAERRAHVRLELAAAYFGRGQATTALDEVKLALAAKPDLAEAYNLRGLIYASMGEAALAEQSFQHALQLAPRNGSALHNYGWFLCQQRRFDDAQLRFDAALDAPGYADAARTLMAQGVCLARAGRWADAEARLGRAFELDPASPAIAFAFSEVLYQRGEYERARFYVRRINGQSEQSNAQSLWLAARIERRLGNSAGVEDFGRQLRQRFPASPEALRLSRGQFDD
ncbi:MAG TPA: type IV pilus biogenesis/stability protein PilW [Rubrivivax sp.]|nr:type IV pilus biogenesis/stability protein PilW [Burkholderiales bacterium]HNU10403.1 type IV pilus biogenesis/stability protein PilW [Rubrivivax sp.]